MPAPAANKAPLLDRSVAHLPGVGPAKAKILAEDLQIHTLGDLLYAYPFRYVDRTQFHRICDLVPSSGTIQVRGILTTLNVKGEGRAFRLVGRLRDDSGAALELVWFKGINVLQNIFIVGEEYIAYGPLQEFNGRLSITHPEMDLARNAPTTAEATFEPVYASTEKLNRRGLDARGRRKLIRTLFEQLLPQDLPEIIPDHLVRELRLESRHAALRNIHLPGSQAELDAAIRRLKYEELFLLQLRLLQLKVVREAQVAGYTFDRIGTIFNRFYSDFLPFALTNAQKRVLKEIRYDLGRGIQMNRLLQGDVGSGKTMVGLMTMLMALDNGFQACLMAPTEILAFQHYESITGYLAGMDLRVAFLSGNVKGKARRELLAALAAGDIDILLGTHALIEPTVVFKNLGLAIIDEQHRFGVEQRAKLWVKNKPYPPHVLVMTATPIPRTLAMTAYGDLDVSVIDELPPGRTPIETVHFTEHRRERVFGRIREEIAKGRQAYIVYPLIEENEKLDLLALEAAYEEMLHRFPRPDYQISVVHGKMKPDAKDQEMARFKDGQTQIMMATTVIEVGVNVPNATIMVIVHTERFGLSQLHQLRGRVGRGAEASYCILLSSVKLSKESRERIKIMTETTDGFKIAEADLRLRGPGMIDGTQQSGILQMRIADLAQDGVILAVARDHAKAILAQDPHLQRPEHASLSAHLEQFYKSVRGWGRIS
ncbi:ATP-dependent DNA helicase RecG [Neolewinella lacunae]|uniref:ATP-dependent DNA helicase RecG n=1 Tax=Neolewinella lacunae TaxID=1517758 RepID=A0A923TEZ7_9BACT|nr:ATP-dependent DNA helicase RecG [Neolewinella lacunae]MBC6996462.1 ATP-dependent DNA helicase RecG [Neolewinella lacunae]MDN3633595.1 ATP-dependent DNA helicase RecG [Neolewinella lacunae]